MAATDGALGEALGAVYVQKAFPPAAKERALAGGCDDAALLVCEFVSQALAQGLAHLLQKRSCGVVVLELSRYAAGCNQS